jgi:hypothetical protein
MRGQDERTFTWNHLLGNMVSSEGRFQWTNDLCKQIVVPPILSHLRAFAFTAGYGDEVASSRFPPTIVEEAREARRLPPLPNLEQEGIKINPLKSSYPTNQLLMAMRVLLGHPSNAYCSSNSNPKPNS